MTSIASQKKEGVIVRRLTASDLGLFAALRPSIASKQRAININSEIALAILPEDAIENGGMEIDCLCVDPLSNNAERRPLLKSGKNWRLGGKKIEGQGFSSIQPGDLFLAHYATHTSGAMTMRWRVITAKDDSVLLGTLLDELSPIFVDGMTLVPDDQGQFAYLAAMLFPGEREPADFHPTRSTPIPAPKPAPVTSAREPDQTPIFVSPIPKDEPPKEMHTRRTMRERIRSRHIMEEMLKVSGELSAPAQLDFIEAMTKLAEQLRHVLLSTGRIFKIDKDHATAWAAVRGKLIASIDGGMANLASLGSAPIAARAGAYLVRPGAATDREHFLMVRELIDELYAAPDGGVYRGYFPDTGALRDAARMSLEAAAAIKVLSEYRDTSYLLLHGALVNPVSRYSDVMENQKVAHAFPEFAKKALDTFLPGEGTSRTGREAKFISVHLRQLQLLERSPATLCGVVERASPSTAVSTRLVHDIPDHDLASLIPKAPDAWRSWFLDLIEAFRINDALLFRCVLEQGECVLPIEIDRNELRRAPDAWRDEIRKYPRPWVSYMLPSEWAAPVRVEVFSSGVAKFKDTASFLMHCAMLLPGYAFPVGLDIVDKFAKIPDWMSRPVNSHTAVEVLRRAIETGDRKQIDAVRRILCGTTRDWLFRPGITR